MPHGSSPCINNLCMKRFYLLVIATIITSVSISASDNVVDAISLAPTCENTASHIRKMPVNASDDDASWTQWLDMGTVNVTYCGAIYTNVNPELPILMRASVSEPGHVQYRIDGYLLSNISPAESRPLIIDIIDCKLYVYPQQLPKLKVNNADGTPFEGTLWVADYSTYLDMVGLRNFYEFDTEELSFDLWLAYYDDNDNMLGDGVNVIEKVRFNLPGWIKPPVIYTVGGDTDTATVPVEIGEAVDHYDYAIVKGGGFDDAGNFLGKRVADKDPSLDIETSSPVNPEVKFTEGEGRYTIGFATYDANGKLLSMSSGPIYYMPEDAANWEPIGKRKITDGFLPDAYHHEPISYEVEVEKSLITEGLFRVVDMYGDTHPYAANIIERTVDFPVYTYFHCEDPEACYISESTTGVIFDSSGEVTISSVPEAYFIRNGYDLSAAKELYPDGFGRLVGGTYTFSKGSLIASAHILLEAGYGWLEVGKISPLTLQIYPEASITQPEAENINEPAEYFNLQGIRVVNPQEGGIYIVRQGSECKKIIK